MDTQKKIKKNKSCCLSYKYKVQTIKQNKKKYTVVALEFSYICRIKSKK